MKGFKCGLEIHQRLSSGSKLFCRCSDVPVGPGVAPSGSLRRRLQAVVGETGKEDRAAVFEQSRGREFVYQLFDDHSCLIDVDEQPPFPINQDALDTVLSISLLLNCTCVDELVVMRKTVVDGSSPSAFQRTALVATGGFLETSRGKVGIQTVCIEEDSAGIVERKHDLVSYRLDRIGIPLVEIATDVSIKDGLHAREVAEKIGLLFRSTGKVQRGIGTIRQDLNVSVAGGARVEIKGAQELSDLKDLVDGEAKRQENLVALRAELKKKGVKFGEFAFVDLTGIFKRTKHTILARQIASRGVVFGLRLPGLAGFLGRELLPNHRFGTELAGYAKAVAGVGGILHSDEEAKFRFSSEELLALEKELSCRKSDAWVLVASGKDRALSALKVVFDRAKLVLKEVPKETRQARGVVSVYLRPLPGGARMYPETDLPRVVIARERIELLENNLPLSLEEKEGKLVDLGLSRELAGRMARSSQLALFEELLASKAEPSFVAGVLLESFTSLRRKGVNVEGVSRESLRELFDFFAKGVIAKAGVEDALVGLAKGHSLRHVVELKGLRKLSVKELKSEVAELKKKGVDEKRLFSEAMRLFRTRADAGDVKEALGMKKGFI